MKLHYAFIFIFLMGTAVPHTAEGEKLTRFDKYIQSRSYESKLFETATALAVHRGACPQPKYQLKRKIQKILVPVSFLKKKFHPVKGAWFENVDVIYCGTTQNIDVTVIANEKDPPDFSAAFTDGKN